MEISLKAIKIKKLSGTELIKIDIREGLFGEPQFTVNYKEKCNYCGYIGNSSKTHTFANTCTISGGSHQCFKCKKSSPFDMHLDASVEFNKFKAKKEEEKKKLEEDKKKKEQEQKKIKEELEQKKKSVNEASKIEIKKENKIVNKKTEDNDEEESNIETTSEQNQIQSNFTDSPEIQNKKKFEFKIEYFIFIPMLSWVPWFNLYFQKKDKALLKWGLLYITPFLLSFALQDNKTKQLPDFVTYVALILYVAGIIHFKSLKTEEKK